MQRLDNIRGLRSSPLGHFGIRDFSSPVAYCRREGARARRRVDHSWRHRLELSKRLTQGVQNGLCVRDESGAGVGSMQPTVIPIEQAGAEMFLRRAEAVAGAGQRHMGLFRRTRKAPQFGAQNDQAKRQKVKASQIHALRRFGER
jgi:hypothetical protein